MTRLFIKHGWSHNIFKFTILYFRRCMDYIKILIILFETIPFLQTCPNLLIHIRIIRKNLLIICLLIFIIKIGLLIIARSLIIKLNVLLISLFARWLLKLSELIPVASFPFFRASLHYYFGNLIKRLLLVILFLVFEKFHLIYKSIFSNRLYFLWTPF